MISKLYAWHGYWDELAPLCSVSKLKRKEGRGERSGNITSPGSSADPGVQGGHRHEDAPSYGGTSLGVNFPRPAIRFPTSHTNEGMAQSCCWTFLELGRRAWGDLDSPLALSLLASPLCLSRVCRVCIPGRSWSSAGPCAVPPLQPHPVNCCSLSAIATQP